MLDGFLVWFRTMWSIHVSDRGCWGAYYCTPSYAWFCFKSDVFGR